MHLYELLGALAAILIFFSIALLVGSVVENYLHHRRFIKKPSRFHGEAGTPTYRSWQHMKARCYNKNDDKYPHYGARGITVCDRWNGSYQEFRRDMGKKPNGTSIDRVNNDGNYEPNNCRWATSDQQNNNSSLNKHITYNGETLTYAQWSRRLGGCADLITKRLRRGWSEERAVTTQP